MSRAVGENTFKDKRQSNTLNVAKEHGSVVVIMIVVYFAGEVLQNRHNAMESK